VGTASVIDPTHAAAVRSPQAQALTPMVTAATTGAVGISGGAVHMPPGGVSKAHVHAETEIIIAVLAGHAATVVWEDGVPRPLLHGPGEMCYVPAGQPHCAVNLSPDHGVLAMEFRTDPAFNDDVVLLPELEEQVLAVTAELRRAGVPTDGGTEERAPHPFVDLERVLLGAGRGQW
jgi:uncharacterized RmlC-like cupin family protein